MNHEPDIPQNRFVQNLVIMNGVIAATNNLTYYEKLLSQATTTEELDDARYWIQRSREQLHQMAYGLSFDWGVH